MDEYLLAFENIFEDATRRNLLAKNNFYSNLYKINCFITNFWRFNKALMNWQYNIGKVNVIIVISIFQAVYFLTRVWSNNVSKNHRWHICDLQWGTIICTFRYVCVMYLFSHGKYTLIVTATSFQNVVFFSIWPFGYKEDKKAH